MVVLPVFQVKMMQPTTYEMDAGAKALPQPWGGQHWAAQVYGTPLPTVAGKSGWGHHTEKAQLHSAGQGNIPSRKRE